MSSKRSGKKTTQPRGTSISTNKASKGINKPTRTSKQAKSTKTGKSSKATDNKKKLLEINIKEMIAKANMPSCRAQKKQHQHHVYSDDERKKVTQDIIKILNTQSKKKSTQKEQPNNTEFLRRFTYADRNVRIQKKLCNVKPKDIDKLEKTLKRDLILFGYRVIVDLNKQIDSPKCTPEVRKQCTTAIEDHNRTHLHIKEIHCQPATKPNMAMVINVTKMGVLDTIINVIYNYLLSVGPETVSYSALVNRITEETPTKLDLTPTERNYFSQTVERMKLCILDRQPDLFSVNEPTKRTRKSKKSNKNNTDEPESGEPKDKENEPEKAETETETEPMEIADVDNNQTKPSVARRSASGGVTVPLNSLLFKHNCAVGTYNPEELYWSLFNWVQSTRIQEEAAEKLSTKRRRTKSIDTQAIDNGGVTDAKPAEPKIKKNTTKTTTSKKTGSKKSTKKTDTSGKADALKKIGNVDPVNTNTE